jgi:hypothetical protein
MRPGGAEMFSDGQTDMTMPAVVFRNVLNAPTNCRVCDTLYRSFVHLYHPLSLTVPTPQLRLSLINRHAQAIVLHCRNRQLKRVLDDTCSEEC